MNTTIKDALEPSRGIMLADYCRGIVLGDYCRGILVGD